MIRFFSSLKSTFFTHYATFRGRTGRGELWACAFVETLLLIGWLFWIFPIWEERALENWIKFWFSLAFFLVLTPPTLGVMTRRLHDVNWNGFWLWLIPVPVANIFLWVVLFLRKGMNGPNRYDATRPPRPLHRNPVCWGVGILVCWMVLPLLLMKLPVPVTPETHFITEPRKPDGQVDYYTPLIAKYDEMFADPEKNGMRDLLQMFGSQVLTDWNNLIGYKKLNLSLEMEPEFPEMKLAITTWLEEHLPKADDEVYTDVSGLKISQEDFRRLENEDQDPNTPEIYDKVLSFYLKFHLLQPWKDEDHPLAAQWVKENDEMLDRIAAAIRKPYLMPYFSEYELKYVFGSNWPTWAKELITVFQVRAMHALGVGDEDGFLENARTIFQLGQHLQKGPTYYYMATGKGIELEGILTLYIGLKSGKLSPQGLEKTAVFLDEILEIQAHQPTLRELIERTRYEVFEQFVLQFSGEYDALFDERVNRCLIDERLLRRTFGEIWFNYVEKMNRDEVFLSSEEREARFQQIREKYASKWSEPWRLLTGTFYRNWYSRNFAVRLAQELDCEFLQIYYRNNRAIARILRIATELELYKNRTGAYPATLAELKFPESVLLDPFSPTKESLKYRLNPESEEAFWKRYEAWKEEKDYDESEFCTMFLQWPPFLLYTVGPDLKDDGGNEGKDWGF